MRKQYPFVLDTDYRLTLGLSAAVFVFLFLLVFLPFGPGKASCWSPERGCGVIQHDDGLSISAFCWAYSQLQRDKTRGYDGLIYL